MALDARYQARLLDPILLVFILRHILLQPVVPFHSLELGPADAELLTIVPTLHRSLQIHVVVLNNSEDDIGRRDAFCSLRCHKFTSFLDLCVDIFSRQQIKCHEFEYASKENDRDRWEYKFHEHEVRDQA